MTITHVAVDLTIQGQPPLPGHGTSLHREPLVYAPPLRHAQTWISLCWDPGTTPPAIPEHVQTCSLSRMYVLQAGGLHPTGMLSCIYCKLCITIDSLKFCNTHQNVSFSFQMELMNVMDTSVGKLIDRQRWQMNNRKPFRTLTVQGRVVMLAGKVLSFDNDINMRQMR